MFFRCQLGMLQDVFTFIQQSCCREFHLISMSCLLPGRFAGIRSALLARAGRGPPGDAAVCHPDGSAVRTPGGPGPDKGGLGQCLCGTARGPGAAGARGLLGAPQLGEELNSPSLSGGASHPKPTQIPSPSSPHRMSEPALQPLEDDIAGTRCGSR